MKKSLILSLFLYLLHDSSICFAQPANNTCATAVTLTYGAACTNGTTTSATIAGDGTSGDPSCLPSGGGGDYNESVWYKVTLGAGQTSLVVSTTAGTLSTANTGMVLYSGTCGSLVEIDCAAGGGAIGAAGLAVGTYYILVDGKGGFDGTFCIAAGAPVVSNDFDCAATTITVGSGCTIGTSVGSTNSSDSDPSCVNGGTNTLNTVWYTFSATDDSITVNYGDGTLQTSLTSAVYSSSNGTCSGTYTEIGCTSNGSEVELTGLTVGSTYFVMVDGKTTDVGTFCVSVYETPPPPPPIGTCLNPRDLYIATDCNNTSGLQYDEQNNMISTNTTTGNDGGASMSGAPYLNSVEQSCGSADVGQQGYWVRFTGTGASVNVGNYGTSGYDYSIFTGTPSNATCTAGLTAVSCLTVAALDLTGNSIATTSGTEYMMLITPSSTGTTTTAFACLTGTTYVPPNDACASATTLSFGTAYELNNSNATVDLNNTLCSGSTENNIWVKYTANYTGTAYVFLQDQDCACGNGMQMSIFNAGASCPNNSSTCSIYINPNNDNDFSGSFSVVNGSTYYIQLDGYAGCGCTFNLCLSSLNSADCSSLLPIELYSFNPYFSDENTVTVDWTTESETQTDYFEVEKSINGYAYTSIGRIQAAGQSSSTINYSLIDKDPYLYGVSYYRLYQQDFNGIGQFFKAVSVVGSESKNILVYPNPTNDKINIEIPKQKGEIEIEIYNSLGKLIYTYKKEENSDFYTIDVENYYIGLYIMKVKTSQKVFSQTFIKK